MTGIKVAGEPGFLAALPVSIFLAKARQRKMLALHLESAYLRGKSALRRSPENSHSS